MLTTFKIPVSFVILLAEQEIPSMIKQYTFLMEIASLLLLILCKFRTIIRDALPYLRLSHEDIQAVCLQRHGLKEVILYQ